MDHRPDLFDLSGCVCSVCRYACHRKCCQKTTSKCSKKVSLTRCTAVDRRLWLHFLVFVSDSDA